MAPEPALEDYQAYMNDYKPPPPGPPCIPRPTRQSSGGFGVWHAASPVSDAMPNSQHSFSASPQLSSGYPDNLSDTDGAGQGQVAQGPGHYQHPAVPSRRNRAEPQPQRWAKSERPSWQAPSGSSFAAAGAAYPDVSRMAPARSAAASHWAPPPQAPAPRPSYQDRPPASYDMDDYEAEISAASMAPHVSRQASRAPYGQPDDASCSPSLGLPDAVAGNVNARDPAWRYAIFRPAIPPPPASGPGGPGPSPWERARQALLSPQAPPPADSDPQQQVSASPFSRTASESDAVQAHAGRRRSYSTMLLCRSQSDRTGGASVADPKLAAAMALARRLPPWRPESAFDWQLPLPQDDDDEEAGDREWQRAEEEGQGSEDPDNGRPCVRRRLTATALEAWLARYSGSAWESRRAAPVTLTLADLRRRPPPPTPERHRAAPPAASAAAAHARGFPSGAPGAGDPRGSTRTPPPMGTPPRRTPPPRMPAQPDVLSALRGSDSGGYSDGGNWRQGSPAYESEPQAQAQARAQPYVQAQAQATRIRGAIMRRELLLRDVEKQLQLPGNLAARV
ncbi:hypothetical protein HYH03_011666 [Edaphochlamys debaryana]|uniref:Uncharacterized protein n=1 Tax=Edaphochlamys debaryana TaxID=47281 RepID=A0A836BW89_9CHLO|nr:hypothetical protein HYH03_011666 [Edaphochlamys debaryana]|eukprot:KAG2489864.1 hypothetical protein HYH03_011666 [Edaphochlamys debaryana]